MTFLVQYLERVMKGMLNLDWRISLGVYASILFLHIIYTRFIKKDKSLKQFAILAVWSLYLLFVLYITILNRHTKVRMRLALEPFWSYKEMFAEQKSGVAMSILFNICLFVPWGILAPIVYREQQSWIKRLLPAFAFSFCVETVQFIFGIGTAEFDDLFNNTLGAFIGFIAYARMREGVGRKSSFIKDICKDIVCVILSCGFALVCVQQFWFENVQPLHMEMLIQYQCLNVISVIFILWLGGMYGDGFKKPHIPQKTGRIAVLTVISVFVQYIEVLGIYIKMPIGYYLCFGAAFMVLLFISREVRKFGKKV